MANSLNTITVDGVTYDAAQYAAEHTTTKLNNDLGKEAFLQLLVAQMKYQDPLDPQDNSEYVAELANFSALEQMTNVSSNLEKLSEVVNNIDTSVLVGQLSSMIGKGINWSETVSSTTVDGKPTTTTETLGGVVKGITLIDGVPTIAAQVGDKTYKVEVGDILTIFEIEDETAENNAANQQQAASTATAQA